MGEVTEAFAACWQAAGVHLQEEAERAGLPLMWLKANLEPPFLEHLSFRFGNQLFFVRLEDADGAVQGPGSVGGLLAIAQGCQGHPCILQMRRNGDEWRPARSGWGLNHATTGAHVVPPAMLTEAPVEMTDWEVHDLAVSVVQQELEKVGRQIMSSQGNPNVDPSLWFVGDDGPEWVVVRAVRYPRSKASSPENWANIAQNCARISDRGNFASVAVANADEETSRSGRPLPLWRGGALHVQYAGLSRHVP